MGMHYHSIWIAADPQRVWNVYADPARIPEWQTGSPIIEGVGSPGDQPRTTYISRRGRLAARTTVIDADPPRRLTTRTAAYFGLRFAVSSQLEGEAGGTTLGLTVETQWPPGLRPFGKLIELAILSDREGRKELANLKALVEREADEADPL